ncbi:hypothetical protein [Cupriavidus pauculus]|uniref:hypothetical protein n=1 Tax=Cupriavidus pauculus TaxID=82633 RepID=UPI0012455980|nr:hypothetical protein [Cupriavidus pauculus]KAB0596397.1 hypothetical protein F7R19_27690 [Cupriavidus pauculus]MBY4733388.1 hypothetical protein [Cupriavidus pauculus]UAL03866.1 hypothetical protein K8O84_28520 [Cupriavidus pauculus]
MALYIYTGMLFEVMKLCLEGRRLHRGWWGGQLLWRGQVVIEDRMDKGAHRVIPHAIMLYSQHQDVAELGVLYDAKIVRMTADDLIVTGFERADFELKEYRQAWLMRPITREEMETPIPADVARGRRKPDV